MYNKGHCAVMAAELHHAQRMGELLPTVWLCTSVMPQGCLQLLEPRYMGSSGSLSKCLPPPHFFPHQHCSVGPGEQNTTLAMSVSHSGSCHSNRTQCHIRNINKIQRMAQVASSHTLLSNPHRGTL